MVVITLPPEIEQIVTERAEQQGTTPEIVALNGLRECFLSSMSPPNPQGTMADFLGDFIGCFDSRTRVPGGANLAENSGDKFQDLLLQKHREGKLT